LSPFKPGVDEEQLNRRYAEARHFLMLCEEMKRAKEEEKKGRWEMVTCWECGYGEDYSDKYPAIDYPKFGKVLKCSKPIMKGKIIEWPCRPRKCKYFKHYEEN